MPFGNVAGFTVNALQFGISENVWVAKQPLASCTRIVKFAVAVAVGVPLITPAALMVKPAGKLPALTVKFGEPVAPVTVKVWL